MTTDQPTDAETTDAAVAAPSPPVDPLQAFAQLVNRVFAVPELAMRAPLAGELLLGHDADTSAFVLDQLIRWTALGGHRESETLLAVVAWDQQRSGRAVVRRTHGSVGVIELNSGVPVEDDDIVLAGADLGATWGLGRSVTLQTDLGYVGLWGRRRLGRAVARGDVRVGQQRAGFTTNTTDTDATTPRAEPTQRLILDGLASDFDVLSAYVALRVGASELFPVTAFGHVAWNLGASGPGEGNALGLVAGVRVGDDAIAGQTAVTLRGLYIEADAALAPLNDDALLTNLEGLAIEASFGAFEGLKFAFDALYSLQVDPDLRGFGDDRGEPGSNDPAAVRLRLSSTWSF